MLDAWRGIRLLNVGVYGISEVIGVLGDHRGVADVTGGPMGRHLGRILVPNCLPSWTQGGLSRCLISQIVTTATPITTTEVT